MVGNLCAERVCIYKLRCGSSCCELIPGDCFHTCLTYPDCKATKLQSHAGIVFAEDSDREVSELAFPLHPIMCSMLPGQPPPSVKSCGGVDSAWWVSNLVMGAKSLLGQPWEQPGNSSFGLLPPPRPPLSLCAPLRLCSFYHVALQISLIGMHEVGCSITQTHAASRCKLLCLRNTAQRCVTSLAWVNATVEIFTPVHLLRSVKEHL